MGSRRSKSSTKPTPVQTSIPSSNVPSGPYVEQITDLASNSKCINYNWKNRGRAPTGYIKGVALSFARSLCRLRKVQSTPALLSMILSSPDSHNDSIDAITHYETNFINLNIPINTAGADPLRAIYTLGIGLGMRESSGTYCEGWDKSAGSNRSSSAAEAGLFQTSYDSMRASGELAKLYAEYQSSNSSRCYLEYFKENVSCGSTTILGSGAGADFQKFTKSCPAFATEYAMTMLRVRRNHYGPINRREAEVISDCEDLLKNVQSLIDRDSQNACQDVF
jgi:hypothetical protein